MRVLKRGKQKVYRVQCLTCHSLLEIKPTDLDIFGFVNCPICKRPISPLNHQLVDPEETKTTTECLQDTKS